MRAKRVSPSSRDSLEQPHNGDQFGTWQYTRLLRMEQKFIRAMTRAGYHLQQSNRERTHDRASERRDRSPRD